jgi:hypothetical protein
MEDSPEQAGGTFWSGGRTDRSSRERFDHAAAPLLDGDDQLARRPRGVLTNELIRVSDVREVVLCRVEARLMPRRGTIAVG